MKNPFNHDFAIYFVLLAVSLLARFAYLGEISATPFYNNAVVDEYVYDGMAKAILKGLPEQDGVFRSPLYPLFLALCYGIFGHSIAVARIIQMLIGGVCTILLYRLALHLFNRRTAFVSGLAYAIYWPAVYFQGELLIISILCPLLVLTIHFYYRALESGSNRVFLISGLLLGLSCLARGTTVFLYPVLAFFILRVSGPRNRMRPLALLTVAMFSLLLVSGLRNYLRTGEFVFLSSNGAINFYTGNNPEADGLNPIPPGLKWNRTIKKPILAGHRSASEQSHYWYRKSLLFIRENPSRFLHLYLKKCYAFWNSVEVSNNKDIYFMRSLSKFLSLPLLGFGIVGPFAILSLLFLDRAEVRLHLLWALILSYMLGNSLFFTAARYRMAVLPCIIIIASYAACSTFDVLKSKNPGMIVRLFCLLAAAVLFVNLDPLNLKGSIMTRPHFQAGQVYLMNNNYDRAIAEMMKDLARYPEDPDILNNLGVAHEKKQNFVVAEEFYRKALETGEYSGIRWNLGVLYYEKGMYKEAKAELLKALEGDPYNPSIQNGLQAVEELLSRTEDTP